MDEIGHLRTLVKQQRAAISLVTGKRESSIVDFLDWSKHRSTECTSCGGYITDINNHTDSCLIVQDYQKAIII